MSQAVVDSPRFVWFGPWSPYHNNSRYADLLPRLRNVRTIKYPLSTIRLVRGAQLRVYPRILTRAVDGLGRTWRGLFCTDIRQISHFRERVVVDHDDPAFTTNEVRALNAPNVKLVVLTTQRARERLVAEGLRSPTAVVPQGVSLRDVEPDHVSRLRASLRTSGDVVIGYTQPFMFCRSDFRALTAAQEMYCIDDLLDAYRLASAEARDLRLWLIGRPSAAVRARTAEMNSVRLCGLVQPSQILSYVANFDIGVYPRFVDLGGRESIKVIQALACGVPVIAANVSESLPVRESGGGIIVDSVDELASAMVRLSKDRETRMALAAKARAFGSRRDWDILARGYDDLLSSYSEQN